MARTMKQEYSKPDGWHLGHRLERQARPAGRIGQVVREHMDEFEGGSMFEPPVATWAKPDIVNVEELGWAQPRHNTPCGGTCRRCYLHDDPAGCIVSEQLWNLFCLIGPG